MKEIEKKERREKRDKRVGEERREGTYELINMLQYREITLTFPCP